MLDAGAKRHGYGWIFPKRDHLNVGVCGAAPLTASYREDLKTFVARLGVDSWRTEGPFAMPVPSRPRSADLATGRVLVVGDAAGLVDSITGEGIAHAIASGRIAAEVVSEALGSDDAGALDAGISEAAAAAARYRARIAAEVVPQVVLLRSFGSVLRAMGPRSIGSLLSIPLVAQAMTRWAPRSRYTGGGTLTIDAGRGATRRSP
ncbi:hypothetical protein K8S17_01065 [bacterium]|nr:hypothetical protein [bacterium]